MKEFFGEDLCAAAAQAYMESLLSGESGAKANVAAEIAYKAAWRAGARIEPGSPCASAEASFRSNYDSGKDTITNAALAFAKSWPGLEEGNPCSVSSKTYMESIIGGKSIDDAGLSAAKAFIGAFADLAKSGNAVVDASCTKAAKEFIRNSNGPAPALETLMDGLRTEFATSPPLAGAYTPKKGDLCAAKFVDDQWYRARIEKMSATEVAVLYIDYGNRASVPKTKLGSLPAAFTGTGGFAKLYSLALVSLPQDEELAAQGVQYVFPQNLHALGCKLFVLGKANQGQAIELGKASSSCESGRKRPKLGLWHRCAVAVVDVQHSHLGRAHFLDP